MTLAEIEQAKKAIAAMRLPVEDVPTRRFKRDARGHRVDMRATLRAGLRDPGIIPLQFKSRRRRRPPLVVLCDISGSMSRYSRLALHFIHALTSDRDRVHQLPVRHAPDQHHAPSAAPRRRRGAGPDFRACAGLVRRHAHRP